MSGDCIRLLSIPPYPFFALLSSHPSHEFPKVRRPSNERSATRAKCESRGRRLVLHDLTLQNHKKTPPTVRTPSPQKEEQQ